ncbi:hypothetical protein BGK67_26705 [Streptomyces subrutilus]|uniref:Uncharacterized protein n=1 Tax=Streptomyces subrutilus TaxID=36818 RepID=A0A1E5Q2M4_9ACTN|nr:hypothetical protein BGK67_26705 [Streptomyces subrutilus]
MDELLRAAARDNAEWCDAVARGHGPAGAFGPDAWTSARRTPPLYPDAVTLAPGASAPALVAAIDTGNPGCSVKDSFADLDLAGDGFEVLFEARWIHRPAAAPAPAAGSRLEWSAVSGSAELARWEAAWDGEGSTGLFHPALPGRDAVFLAGRAGGRIVAGAVAHRGSGAVVGLSNLFAHDEADTDAAWAGALTAIAARWPDLPVVGYESGDDLAAAVRAGFTPVGPLRVWLHTA